MISAAVVLFWLGIWSQVCYIANRNLLMPLPYPSDVAASLKDLVTRADFWLDVGISLLRIVIGFILAVLCGAGLAIITTRSRLTTVGSFTEMLRSSSSRTVT